MNMFNRLKSAIPHVLPSLTVLMTSQSCAAEGFSRANTIGEKIATGLHGLAAITITIAVIWVGYKTLWIGDSLKSCGYIIIGGILIGGSSEIGALLVG